MSPHGREGSRDNMFVSQQNNTDNVIVRGNHNVVVIVETRFSSLSPRRFPTGSANYCTLELFCRLSTVNSCTRNIFNKRLNFGSSQVFNRIAIGWERIKTSRLGRITFLISTTIRRFLQPLKKQFKTETWS